VRKKIEATGAVAPVEKRTGKDGRVRKPPTTKKQKPSGFPVKDEETGKQRPATETETGKQRPATETETAKLRARTTSEPTDADPDRKWKERLGDPDADHLAKKLIEVAPEFARELQAALWRVNFPYCFANALRRELGADAPLPAEGGDKPFPAEDNDVDTAASAEAMKAAAGKAEAEMRGAA
jgi:hypothetical protein